MKKSFYQILTEAINYFAENGFRNEKMLDFWVKKLRESAYTSLIPEKTLIKELERSLGQVYKRLVINGGVLKTNPGVAKFTIDKLKPKMRAELDRRITTSVSLIKLNREEAVSTMLRRFQGWATSVPIGGSHAVDRREEKDNVKKSLNKLNYEERRVLIDQTHKLAANINDIVAKDNKAIAAEWRSNWRQQGYNYRKDHKERDRVVYAIRDSWAMKNGYIKPINGYTDDITMPSEEVYCQCRYKYIYAIDALPAEMLTSKGKTAIESRKIVVR